MDSSVKRPLISVLMSVYNGEKYLREAIESILAQTFADFEFLIINDGSTDSSRDIILSYSDARIRLIDNEEKIGLTKSLNKGISLARGKYIARMDADDISMPERIEKQVGYMDIAEDYVLVGAGAYLIDANGNEIGRLDRPFTHEEILGHIFFFNPVIHPSVMFRKAPILKIGGYNPDIQKAQDYDLWLRLVDFNMKFCNLPSLLIKHREHEYSIEAVSFDDQEKYARATLKQAIKKNLNLDASEYHIVFIRKYGNVSKISVINKILLVIFLFRMLKLFKYRFKSISTELVFKEHAKNLIINVRLSKFLLRLTNKLIEHA